MKVQIFVEGVSDRVVLEQLLEPRRRKHRISILPKKPTWRQPAETQNLDNPPKYVVEELFWKHTKRRTRRD